MPRIHPIEYETANERQKKEFEDQINKNGRITNMKRTLLHSPIAFQALMEWYPLRDETLKFISERELNLFAHSISTQNNCLVCSTFFRKILIDSGENPDKPFLSKKEELLLEFGGHCVVNSTEISDELFDGLKAYFSEKQIVVLTAFAALMIATNLINSVLKVELDDYLLSYKER